MTEYVKHNRRNLIIAGILIIGIGKLWLFHEMNLFSLPEWLFTWKMLLIVIGLLIGLMTRFKELFWTVPVIIGTIFMLGDIPGFDFDVRNFAWPIVVIIFGMYLLIRAFVKTGSNKERWCGRGISDNSGGDDYIDSTSIFGGNKRKIFSKNFKGGETVNIFGGTELDLSQADIQGKVVIDATQIFGGLKIVVPANWEVRTEMTAIMGGIDDKRTTKDVDGTKVLVITGVCIFGGVDIRSY